MNSFTDIFARLKDAYAARHEPEKLRPITVMYWRALLLSAFVGGILILAAGMWEFVSVLSVLNAPSSGVTTPPPSFNRAQLESVLRAYQDRAATYEAVKVSPPVVTDPSRK